MPERRQPRPVPSHDSPPSAQDTAGALRVLSRAETIGPPPEGQEVQGFQRLTNDPMVAQFDELLQLLSGAFSLESSGPGGPAAAVATPMQWSRVRQLLGTPIRRGRQLLRLSSAESSADTARDVARLHNMTTGEREVMDLVDLEKAVRLGQLRPAASASGEEAARLLGGIGAPNTGMEAVATAGRRRVGPTRFPDPSDEELQALEEMLKKDPELRAWFNAELGTIIEKSGARRTAANTPSPRRRRPRRRSR